MKGEMSSATLVGIIIGIVALAVALGLFYYLSSANKNGTDLGKCYDVASNYCYRTYYLSSTVPASVESDVLKYCGSIPDADGCKKYLPANP